MAWLTENWIWVLFGVAFIAMHLFGHGGHRGHGGRGGGCGHGGHGSGGVGDGDGDGDPNKTADERAKGEPPGATGGGREPHRH